MHRTGHEEGRNVEPWLWAVCALGLVVGTTAWLIEPNAGVCRAALPAAPVASVPAYGARSVVTAQQISSPVRQSPPEQAEARFYDVDEGVACSLPDLPADGYYVSVPTGRYAGATACGSYVDIDGPLGSVRAQIVDRCPGCVAGQYDLSRAAFAAVADPSDGVAQVRVSRVHDPSPAPEIFYRIEQGSSQDWLGLLVSGTGNPLVEVALRSETGGEWRPLRRGNDNYWTISSAGPGPFAVRITDADDHVAVLPGIAVEPGQVRYTGIRLYGTSQAGPVAVTAAPPSRRTVAVVPECTP